MMVIHSTATRTAPHTPCTVSSEKKNKTSLECVEKKLDLLVISIQSVASISTNSAAERTC